MTTFEPGASEVLTHGLEVRPFSTALRASRPAASITLGFDVFVQDVIAAMTTWPWSRNVSVPSAIVTGVASSSSVAVTTSSPGVSTSSLVGLVACPLESPLAGGSDAGKDSSRASSWLSCSDGTLWPSSLDDLVARCSSSEMRSCGRLGPASDGTTSPRSSSSVSEYVGSSVSSSCHMPCAFA